jgi:glutathione S-transferase
VDLKNKPPALLNISPKATVPVLHLSNGSIIDESLDIMHYALKYSNPENIPVDNKQAKDLISDNDKEFAILLKKYKYANRYPEAKQEDYRQQIEQEFLLKYEQMLENKDYLLGNKSIVDYAILPFIRQFAFVDKDWFYSSNYINLIKWLTGFIENNEFEQIVMKKYTPWQESDRTKFFIVN